MATGRDGDFTGRADYFTGRAGYFLAMKKPQKPCGTGVLSVLQHCLII